MHRLTTSTVLVRAIALTNAETFLPWSSRGSCNLALAKQQMLAGKHCSPWKKKNPLSPPPLSQLFCQKKDNMKLSVSALALLALSGSANAWSTSIRVTGARSLSAAALFGVSTEQAGETATESFRLNFKEGDKQISPWHDIPLKGEKGYNMVVEIPKMTKAKMEIATKEESNPIAQDIKKGNLRDYHGPIFWNYGCLPQTWEDPNEEHPELKVFGDDGE
jgi:hypothetical protein